MSNARGSRDSVRLAACMALIAVGSGGCSDAGPQAPIRGSYGGTSGGQGGTGGVKGGAGGTGAQNPGGSTGRASTGNTPLPCDVDEAVRRNCQSCHAARPLSGVPMALVTWEDFQQRAVTNSSLAVHRLADMRIHDAARPMPPPPQMLPGQDKTALEAWLAMGAPAGTGCGTGGTGGTGGGGGTAGVGGSAGSAGTGGSGGMPPDQGECYDLLAHDASSKTAPYQVTREEYVNYYFDAPWPANAQGISFESVFDQNPDIVHHWLLYVAGTYAPQSDGVVESNADGSHFGATLVAGWAPGGNNGLNLPPDVGLDINGQSRKLVLELHFYANSSFTSRSGVKVCTTKTPRKNLATVSWLGTEIINIPARAQAATVSGTCAPSTSQQIHILRSWPHMHRIGTHMKTVIQRAGGGTEVLHDKPFNFNTQIAYDTPAILNPGDRLTTTCTYRNDSASPVRYGINTSNEMCFNFVTAWPAGLLQHGTHTGGAANPCLN
jgi:hypothetical protein